MQLQANSEKITDIINNKNTWKITHSLQYQLETSGPQSITDTYNRYIHNYRDKVSNTVGLHYGLTDAISIGINWKKDLTASQFFVNNETISLNTMLQLSKETWWPAY